MTLLHVQNLSVAFRRPGIEGPHTVVNDVSFSIDAGETFALVGESGSGKSVSALSILGLLPYPAASHPSGSITFAGQDLLNKGDRFLQTYRGQKIGMIFQEPMTALNPLHSIEKQISESLLIHTNLSTKQVRTRIIDLLKLVGFPDGADRLKALPHQLSGGQRQRVMIAMALACEPQLLIADEPTTALDVTIQAAILKLMKDLQKEFNMGLLLISHDLGIVRRIADTLGVMRQGELVEKGETTQIFAAPTHPYTKMLIDAEPGGKPAPIAEDVPTILETEDIRVTFDRQKTILFQRKPAPFVAVNKISLSLKTGETLGIVGESGSGKSTLAYAILRLAKSTGSLIFNNIDINAISRKELRHLRQDIQIIFQDPFSSLNPRLSIGQIIAEGLEVHASLNAGQIEENVIRSLEEVGMDAKTRHRYPHEFSGGQRQRIAIARALILKPKLLVLDEPTSALDRSIQAEIIDLLRKLQQKHGLSYLFISHDLKVVQAMSHRIIVMKNGEIIETGLTADIIQRPQTDYARNLMHAAFQD